MPSSGSLVNTQKFRTTHLEGTRQNVSSEMFLRGCPRGQADFTNAYGINGQMSQEPISPVFYSVLQRRLHWLVIVLLAGQFSLQGPMRDALAAIDRNETLGFIDFLITTTHTWSGICIAAIMLWRWKLRSRKVPLNGGHLSQGLVTIVKIHHVSLYVVIIAMAISGALHYYAGWQIAARWHELGKWLLLVLILFHVAGAFIHAFQGHTVLHRMMGRNSLR